MRQSIIIAAIAVLMVGPAARSEHASLPDGVTPVMATWLWGYHTIPASITKDGSPYLYAYPHTDASRINDPPWTEVAVKHIKAGAKAPAVIFLHGCSGLFRGGLGYRILLMSEGYAVFEPDAYARPGHSCATSSVTKRSEEVAYALNQIRRLPWIDHDRIILMGNSEGGRTVAFWDQPGFIAHVILAAPAYLRAPANVPVLAIAGVDDTFADANTSYRQKKTVTPAPHGIKGTWVTSWGVATFVDDPSGGTRGEYSYKDGRIVGTLQGNTLHGYWIQADSKRKCARPREGSLHWGRVRVKFDDRFSAFSGASSRCDKPVGPTNDWDGYRPTSRASKTILIAGAGHDILGHPELKEAIKNFLRECCQ